MARSKKQTNAVGFAQGLVVILVLFGLSTTAGARALKGKATVVDGDSLVIDGREVRLHGLDAPELEQDCVNPEGLSWPCGTAARDALASLVQGKDLTCQRALISSLFIGDCRVDGQRVSAWMLAQGWAIVDRRGSRRYVGFESQARRAQRNLWAGQFERPWKWRQQSDGPSAWNMVLQDNRTVEP